MEVAFRSHDTGSRLPTLGKGILMTPSRKSWQEIFMVTRFSIPHFCEQNGRVQLNMRVTAPIAGMKVSTCESALQSP